MNPSRFCSPSLAPHRLEASSNKIEADGGFVHRCSSCFRWFGEALRASQNKGRWVANEKRASKKKKEGPFCGDSFLPGESLINKWERTYPKFNGYE